MPSKERKFAETKKQQKHLIIEQENCQGQSYPSRPKEQMIKRCK